MFPAPHNNINFCFTTLVPSAFHSYWSCVFHPPVWSSRVFQSRVFHPCKLVPRFSSLRFSSPAFSVVPMIKGHTEGSQTLLLIRRKGRCGVFADNCVIHIWALNGRVTDDRRYPSSISFSFPFSVIRNSGIGTYRSLHGSTLSCLFLAFFCDSQVWLWTWFMECHHCHHLHRCYSKLNDCI